MRRAQAGALAVALVLILVLSAISPLGAGRAAVHPVVRLTGISSARAAASDPCGPAVAAAVSGTLREYGNLSPVPSVSGVGLEYGYAIEVSFTPSGSSMPQVSCMPALTAMTTNSTGGFSLSVSLPSGGCTLHGCTSYAGPDGPATFGSAAAPPPGYFVHGTVANGRGNVSLTEAFGSLVLSPPTPVLLSVNASTPFSATAYAADGSPSPVSWASAWQLAYPGWSLIPGPGNLSARVEASEGAGPALLGLVVNGSYGGHRFSDALRASLLAASTRIGAEALLPVPVDVGSPLTLSLGGAGAPGYAYRAIVEPGLGVAPLSVNCSSTGAPVEEVALECAASWSYPAPGTAHPSVELSNGYSNASVLLGSVPVDPRLALVLSPRPLATYSGAPLPLTVSVSNGTGSAPFGPACVETGTGSPVCSTSPGPSWSFALAYPGTGEYPLTASVTDSAQALARATGTVTVANRPYLYGLAIEGGGGAAEGVPSELEANLSGGVAPVEYWWNSSAPASTFATGVVGPGGGLSAQFVPSSAGENEVTLTCVDALGTRVASDYPLYVEPGPAVALAFAGAAFPSAGSAGVPVLLSLEAAAPDGARVTDFARPLTIGVTGPEGAEIYLNGSLDAKYPPIDGAFALPLTAWADGYLNLSFEGLRSGAYTLTITAGVPLEYGSGGPLPLTLGADPYRLALESPRTALAGARSNSTEYRLVDGFGNPGAPGAVWVESRFGASDANQSAAVVAVGNLSYVWVNYSAPTAGGGTVRVWSSAGRLLLAPIAVPATPAEVLPVLPIALGGLAGLTALVGGFGWARRSRRDGAAPKSEGPPAEASEADLRREATGRAQLLERLHELGPSGLDRLRADWPEPVPGRGEIAEWLAAMVTEGSVRASEGPSGGLLYAAVPERAEERPRVELDSGALDRALARGELEAPDAEAPAPASDP